MADQLYLSYWIRGFTERNMLDQLETALRRFPFSRLAPGLALRIFALEFAQPPVLERSFAEPADIDEIIPAAGEFLQGDCAYQVDGAWDLWQWDREWELRPAAVSLVCYGPAFSSERGEQLRIEFGPEFHFLPAERPAGRPHSASGGSAARRLAEETVTASFPTQSSARSLTPIRSNIRSLLHLAGDLDQAFRVEKRLLWSESGENLAGRLEEAARQQ